MLIKQGGAGGGSADIADAPKITFDGKWLPWHVDFYDGTPYWEAWFLTSGTLTVEGSYTADAWGIGGGGTPRWSSSGGRTTAGLAGIPGMALGVALSGAMAVTIGAGGDRSTSGNSAPGGSTQLGSVLTCNGSTGTWGGYGPPTDAHKRYRFEDPEKAGEGGSYQQDSEGHYAQDGWLAINRTMPAHDDGVHGAGFGAGGGYYGYAAPGALVIRIPM